MKNHKKENMKYIRIMIILLFAPYLIFIFASMFESNLDCKGKMDCHIKGGVEMLHTYADRIVEAKDKYIDLHGENPSKYDLFKSVDDSRLFRVLYNGFPFNSQGNEQWDMDEEGNIFMFFTDVKVINQDRDSVCKLINNYSNNLMVNSPNKVRLKCITFDDYAKISVIE
ncbi:hypothetical protein ACXHQ0_15120 [Vibrio antiquarius]|uniref:Uncharacterized protein n=2 Tax=Vibrio parahaemolyticus TaxID=670 RepID=A0AA46Z9C2_VIBPH|nr:MULTISPECIES: hypothetical protein [Vibrio harveyi group]MCS0314404.1 hypothetical protein [Vibrio diabolicus]UYV29620.1 hypothetical protein M5598_26960 [Vibrio parahaemolyticus]UYW19336.1 hypothetical protein IF561_29335 [Vibrio parahaemolyticus]